MVCIYCGSKTKVGNSRSSVKTHSTWRRRECLGCHSVFTTRETVDYSGALRVRDQNGRLEPFQREKLVISLHNSLSHRKTAISDATALTDTIITRLVSLQQKGIIQIEQIKSSTLSTLKQFDQPAASHYKAHHFPIAK
jgi:transcriptional regulator NrdR family protein